MPMSNILFDTLLGNPAQPDKVCMELADGSGITCAGLIEETGRFANALTAMGVKAGDRVAVQVEKSADVIALYLGAVRAGAVFLPLNTAYTPAEIGYFLEDAKPSLFVCGPGSAVEKAGLAERLGIAQVTLGPDGSGTLMPAVRAASPEFATVARGGNDLAAMLYTSGTTGRAKGAMLTHTNLASNSLTLVDAWRFTAADVLLHALPIFHTHGLFVATNTVLIAGGSMLFLPRFDAEQVISLLPRATAMMGVPTFYTRLLDHPGFTAALTEHMRVFISGSAPLLAETHRAFSERTGHAIVERYGMTETTMNSSNPYDGDRRAGTVGFPLAGIEMRVADPETGTPLPVGEIGVVEVRGPNVFQGYWQMPEKTAAEFRADGFFITGDLGKVDEDGYFHIVGRGKDLIISGGFNVYPKEVETEIDQMEGVVESAVIGVPHADFGEGVAAVIVVKPDAGLTETGVQAHLAERLAKFKQPKRVFFVADLPRNAMGKVQKNELRSRYADTFRK
jgi:malonyl-CoA/methylmalonyl-CoA synthetase